MVNVILATDEAFCPFVPPVLNSVIKNNDEVAFYILCTGVGRSQKNSIRSKFAGELPIHFFDVVPEITPQPVRCRLRSVAMFNRIFAIDMLAACIDKGLYLDVDTIVDHGLDELYATETGECGLAAVIDPYMPYLHQHLAGDYSVRPIPISKTHVKAFNSGVLLMDFRKLAKNSAQKQLIDTIRETYMTDQPALNLYSFGRFTDVSDKWNVSANYCDKLPGKFHERFILHWHGVRKPWDGRAPFQDRYDRYRI